MIPHRFPFVFADPGVKPGRRGLRVLITAGGWLNRSGELSPFLALEILAQAALVELRQPAAESNEEPGRAPRGESVQPAIAGIDEVVYHPRWAHQPPRAGDVLYAQSQIAGRFGSMLKVEATLSLEGSVILRATLLLVS